MKINEKLSTLLMGRVAKSLMSVSSKNNQSVIAKNKDSLDSNYNQLINVPASFVIKNPVSTHFCTNE